MVDAVAILRALRLDYDFVHDDEGMVWHRKGNRIEGPFMNLDSAAYAALDDHQYGQMENEHENSCNSVVDLSVVTSER